MSTQMLCGDEVQSAMVDIGSAFSKFGDGGQELPRHVFRSDVGKITIDDTPLTLQSSVNSSKYVVGDTSLRYHNKINSANIEISKPFENGSIHWDVVEQILSYGLNDCMRANSKEYPILLAESYFQSLDDKAKLSEILFESMEVPAMFMCSTGTLSSFSVGRPTALVIDIGASKTAISPVIDGYALHKGTVVTSRGGDMVDTLLHEQITISSNNNGNSSSNSKKENIVITPWHDRYNKSYYSTSTNANATTPTTNNSNITTAINHKNIRQLFVNDVIRDIKSTLCFIPYKPLAINFNNNETEFMKSLIVPHYELPDGTILTPQYPLCSVPEKLIFPTTTNFGTGVQAHHSTSATGASSGSSMRKRSRQEMIVDLHTSPYLNSELNYYLSSGIVNNSSNNSKQLNTNNTNDDHLLPLHYLIMKSLSYCDVDTRRELLNNIILVGGGSLTDGLMQRLTYELTEILPPQFKMKFVSTVPIEKHYGTWIGGSILSICGTFQQSWVSKQDYDEYGASRICQRFNH